MAGIARNLIAVLIAASLSVSHSLSQTAALANARNDLQAGNLAGAETETRTYLAAQPASAEAMYLLGYILERRNQPTESLAWFTKAASLARPSGEDLRVVALDYVLLNSYPDALRWLARSVADDPLNPEAWYDLGRAHMMQGEYPDAEAALLKALALKPRLVKAENNLGVVYEGQNQPAKAAAAYQQAIDWQQAEPHPSEQPLLNLGTLLLKQGHAAEALPLLRKAVEIAPNDVHCNEQLARALEKQGDMAAAIEHMTQATAQEPGSARLHYELGQMYRRSGQPEKAKQELTLSEQLYGSHSNSDR